METHEPVSAISISIPSARSLRSNIWRGVLSASEQEIRDGMDFYPGAHGLCRMFARIFSVSVSCVAGIYAALSPMNGWDTNVANALSVLRHGWHSTVNTSHMNHWKALAILHGADPEQCLGKSKVLAFYRAIANPLDLASIPVDRHLICLAIGRKVTDKNELRAIAGNRALLSRIHAAYTDLGAREGVGNRLASIAWFVQRRVRSSQLPIPLQSAHLCCQLPMMSHGPTRFRCRVCRRTRTRLSLQHNLPPRARKIPHSYLDGYPVHLDSRGRKRVYLGKIGGTGALHPLANSGGWQYVTRYLVARELGEGPLRTDEHVHHTDCDRTSDPLDLSNYELINPVYHGRFHASAVTLAGYRDSLGRFTRYTDEHAGHADHADGAIDTPEMVDQTRYYPYPRFRAILGPAAREAANASTSDARNCACHESHRDPASRT